MKKPSAIETIYTKIVTVLSVSPADEDHSSLQSIFGHSKWVLYKADRLETAHAILQEHEIGAVLCESNLRPGTWVDMLERMKFLPHMPPLIVTSRLADEKLWGEALSLGAYDVLAKPFEPKELFRSVSLAWLQWLNRSQQPARKMGLVRAAG